MVGVADNLGQADDDLLFDALRNGVQDLKDLLDEGALPNQSVEPSKVVENFLWDASGGSLVLGLGVHDPLRRSANRVILLLPCGVFFLDGQ